ncbi:TonB-dependent receptor plug domain-containing protein [Brevundimonas vesicularis]|uniref:TonB-dependent receptor plug domain-containing protein n=1 Tax=Brevundimonas vesicularis TaxID=41276 RepID=UPI0022AC1DBF|nr:TonB-dependent receptor [Brevundimonas vesicularis]
MRSQNQRRRLLESTIIAGFAMIGLSTPALAQSTDEAVNVDEVVVTGSRIPQANLRTTSPVTQVTGEDIRVQGVTRVEDLVNQLPQAFAAQNSTVSNGASGTATVDLRALGPDRTLVLIDGRRMGYGSPNDTAADLNQIPGQLVERVEVLTGGAAAVYGSDAIAGVVNFIMKKDFEGLQVDAQYGFFQHHNDYDGPGNLRTVIQGRSAGNPAQFKLPDDDVMDGFSREVTIAMGVNAPDGRGNVTAFAGYRKNNKILGRDRDYSACSLGGESAGSFTCGGSSTNATGRFLSLDSGANLTVADGGGFRNYTANDAYNFGPLNYYQRPDERYTLGAFGNYQVNDKIEAFASLNFSDYSTVAQIAPSGIFFGGGTSANGGYNISCSNPLLTPAQAAQLGCAPGVGSVEVLIGRRNVEGGGRQDDISSQNYRGVVGIRGDLSDVWSYDLAASYSKVSLSRIYRNEFSNTRIGRALDVAIDPATGQAACVSAIDPDGPTGPLAAVDAACVPYNLYAPGGVTQAALNYIQVPGLQRGITEQQVITLATTGDLTQYVRSPLAEGGLQVAFGAEYRRDKLVATSDQAFETGDLAGQGGPTQSVAGSVQVYDLFGEFRMPLIEGRPFAEQVSINGSYRRSTYDKFNSDAYGLGVDWAPISDLRFRASLARTTRAPNVIELFRPEGLNLYDADGDPCGPNPTATLAQCVATGVPAGQYGLATDNGGLLESPAGQYNFLQKGNADLAPETADTFTVGAVITPSFLPGLNVSIDYYDIDLKDRIDIIDPLVTLDNCYVNNEAAACSRIVRSDIGTLWTTGGYIEAFNTNIGGLKTSGIDINANYSMDLERVGLESYGSLAFNMVGSWLEKLETDPGAGAAAYDCVGKFAGECGTPKNEWRHRARVTWQMPWNADLSATWRYYGEVENVAGAGRLDSKFDAQNYFDLSGSIQLRDNLKLRAGINNILDRDPPLSYSVGTTGNNNTYPQTYDAMGRFMFIGITADF